MPPVFVLTLGVIGAAALLRWYGKEVHRNGSKGGDLRGRVPVEPIDREALPKLKRDPSTGEYRPG